MRCTQCDVLLTRIADLEATVRALRLMVQDLGGLPVKEDPYEDEAPLVVWEEKE